MSNVAPLFDDVYDWLTQSVQALAADGGCFHLRSRTGDRVICQAVTDGLKATHLSYGLDLTACPAVAEVIESGRALPVDNAVSDLRVAQVARERFGLKSVLYQPVRIGSAVEAVAIFSFRRPHRWTADEVSTANALTEQIEGKLGRVELGVPSQSLPHELMLDAIPGVVSVVDQDLLTVAASRSVDPRRALDGQRASISVDELLRDSDRGHELRSALLDILGGDLDQFQGIVRTGLGQWWLHLSAAASSEAGGARQAVVHAQPMPDTKSALVVNEERARLEALGRIAASVAHEVNNALQHIRLSLGEMHGEVYAEERATIATATERAGRVTSQLLTFARRAPSQFQPLDLAEYVSREFELARRSVGTDHDVNLRVRGHAQVLLDAKKMQLVLINLCRNAAEASPGGSEVTIETGVERRGSREFAYIAVIDSGEGMPESVAQRLGEFQSSTKPEGLGAGIGLAVVKQVADDHGGEVVATPQPDGGTRVAVYLPLHVAPTHPSGPVAEPKGSSGPRILIVEDEVVVARLVARSLRRLGHRTEMCSSLSSARAFFDGDPSWPDLVIVDLKLGDGTGLEFFEHAREVRPELPFVAMSGFAERESILAFSRAGYEVVSKPFSRDELHAAVAAALARAN